MRAHQLLVDLKNFVESSLADFALPNPATGQPEMGRARCFLGNVPDDDQTALPERFPFVVIRWVEGEDAEDGDALEEAALIFGVYSPAGADEAELLTAALLDHMRRALMALRILGNVFDLILPLKSAKPDPEKRQHNYHMATIITRWRHLTPRRPLNQGDFDDGQY
ncbi:MAG: hypothetical protein LBV79_08235 [Candidatus Adiutrix sp.]|jgi:hypothetical protein|nr:hypothetical protein [Candidatus Adiutrix sp.]